MHKEIRITKEYWDFIITVKHPNMTGKEIEVMLTTDDDIEKKVKANKSLIQVRVENPVRWLMEVTENGS